MKMAKHPRLSASGKLANNVGKDVCQRLATGKHPY
jgi:hypothetical protein